MCGRFYLTAGAEEVKAAFNLQRLPNYETSYNIPPGQNILAIMKLDEDGFKAVNLHWGLIPHWSKDHKISHHLINARAETVAQKPAFRSAYQQRRCLIPVNGFYEWHQLEQHKQAYSIAREDQQLFALAGLWEYWQHNSETLYSCTIITTTANEFMSTIHQRMSVIIGNQHYNQWLDKQTPTDELKRLLRIDAYQDMTFKPVSDWVNNPRHDDKNCLS